MSNLVTGPYPGSEEAKKETKPTLEVKGKGKKEEKEETKPEQGEGEDSE